MCVCGGGGGGYQLRFRWVGIAAQVVTYLKPIDSNRSFPVMSIFRIVSAALETLRHMLDFRSNVSCFGSGKQTCGWAIWITTFATNLVSCSAVKVNV